MCCDKLRLLLTVPFLTTKLVYYNLICFFSYAVSSKIEPFYKGGKVQVCPDINCSFGNTLFTVSLLHIQHVVTIVTDNYKLLPQTYRKPNPILNISCYLI